MLFKLQMYHNESICWTLDVVYFGINSLPERKILYTLNSVDFSYSVCLAVRFQSQCTSEQLSFLHDSLVLHTRPRTLSVETSFHSYNYCIQLLTRRWRWWGWRRRWWWHRRRRWRGWRRHCRRGWRWGRRRHSSHWRWRRWRYIHLTTGKAGIRSKKGRTSRNILLHGLGKHSFCTTTMSFIRRLSFGILFECIFHLNLSISQELTIHQFNRCISRLKRVVGNKGISLGLICNIISYNVWGFDECSKG